MDFPFALSRAFDAFSICSMILLEEEEEEKKKRREKKPKREREREREREKTEGRATAQFDQEL